MRNYSVLLIEDSRLDSRLVCGMLKPAEGEQFAVACEQRLEAGIQELHAKPFDVVLLDLNLPDSQGMATFSRVQSEFPHLPIIIMTAMQDMELALLAVSNGAQDFLIKGEVSRTLLVRVLRYGIERKRAEQRFRLLMETAPTGIIFVDAKGRIVDANAHTLGMFGYERKELIGQSVDSLLPEALRSKHEKHRDSYMAYPHARPMGIGMELFAHRKDGTEFPVEISLGPLVTHGEGLVSAAIVDVTVRKGMEQRLRLSERMEAISQLAGGVAHDFNNLMGVIIGCAEVLPGELPPSHPALRKIEMITKAAASAADLTRQLLAFGRKQLLHPVVIHPKEILKGVEDMLRRIVGENIDLAINVAPAVGCIKADPGQVEQVLLNLVLNARDAMPMGGKLTIEVCDVEVDDAYREKHQPVVPGPYVLLAVGDTGCGMSPETQSRVFDPFFTTKELGKGTGLGLATVYGIVKQSGGHIWVYSELGQGTVFKVYFPRVESSAQPRKEQPAETALGGCETILLAEDSDSLREMARTYLESVGYTVLEAVSGKQALQCAKDFQGKIHLLLTDVIMPEMSGPELAKHIASARPNIRIIFTSGYADDAVFRHGVLDQGAPFIQKPYRPKLLAKKIREVLGSPREDAPVTAGGLLPEPRETK